MECSQVRPEALAPEFKRGQPGSGREGRPVSMSPHGRALVRTTAKVFKYGLCVLKHNNRGLFNLIKAELKNPQEIGTRTMEAGNIYCTLLSRWAMI
jgi:hypothetical protein